MEDHAFCDHCPGCRPAILNVQTGESLPPDDPIMIAVNQIWDKETTYAQRKAFIEVTLHNSRTPYDMELFQQVSRKVNHLHHKGGGIAKLKFGP